MKSVIAALVVGGIIVGCSGAINADAAEAAPRTLVPCWGPPAVSTA